MSIRDWPRRTDAERTDDEQSIRLMAWACRGLEAAVLFVPAVVLAVVLVIAWRAGSR